MQDNSTQDIIEMLTRYIDGELSAEEKQSVEALLKKDISVQQRYQHLLAAKQAIKMQGLKERVNKVHKEYLVEREALKTEAKQPGRRISIFKTFMSVAAMFILVVAGYGIFQYTATTNESVYNENFINYTAPVSRGEDTADDLPALYNEGKYAEAIQSFNSLSNKKQQDYFIAAQAYLHLNNPKAAIDNFKQLENLNNNSAEKYFAPETDYYLLLAFIKYGSIDKAEKQLDKITADKQHLFYNKSKGISRTKLKMLEWKDN